MPIEQKAAELERIVSLDEEIEWLGDGFGGFDERGSSKASPKARWCGRQVGGGKMEASSS